jgi:hypothetical protein
LIFENEVGQGYSQQMKPLWLLFLLFRWLDWLFCSFARLGQQDMQHLPWWAARHTRTHLWGTNCKINKLEVVEAFWISYEDSEWHYSLQTQQI